MIQVSIDFLSETSKARRQWKNIFKVLKEKNGQPRILYPVKISLKMKTKIKRFSEEGKRCEVSDEGKFITSISVLKQMQ